MLNFTSDDITVHGVKLHYYRTVGNKPPLVLVHGITDDGLCRTPVAEVLSNAFDVIMVVCWLLGSSVKFFGILRRNFRQALLLFLPGWARLFFECTPKSFG